MRSGKRNMSNEIKFENNAPKILKAWENKKIYILYAWGLKWQALSTKIITRNKIVDTGRLRASLTFITSNKKGGSLKKSFNSKNNDFLKGTAPKDSLIVGSNVSYAAEQEIGNPKGAFVKPAITEYRDSYKNIAEKIMKD